VSKRGAGVKWAGQSFGHVEHRALAGTPASTGARGLLGAMAGGSRVRCGWERLMGFLRRRGL
jgi:hypothetical protein